MAESLFQRKSDTKPAHTSPLELIEREIEHLKKRTSVRYGANSPRKMSIWLLVLTGCALVGLYILDPIEHAWYKYDATKAYLYLHNYGASRDATMLAASGILRPDEIHQLDQRQGSYQDTYATPKAAAANAQDIVAYMRDVKQLHAGAFQNLDTIGRLRYNLFIRPGIFLPTSWDFLDPGIGD